MLDFSLRRVLWILFALAWAPQSRAKILQPTSMVPVSTTSGTPAQHTTRMASRWAGKVNPAVLFRRAPVTCGYQLADTQYPMTCPQDETCIFDNDLWWGPYCCGKDSSGNWETGCDSSKITTCLNYGEAGGYMASSQTVYNQSLYCPSSYQYCATVLFTISTISTLNGEYTSYECDTYSGAIYPAEQTAASDITTTTSLTTTSYTTSTSSPTETTSEDADTATSTSEESTTSTSSISSVISSVSNETTPPVTTSTDSPVTGSAAPAESDNSNAAAIGGGVGGGIGGALAIAGIVGYLIHRKKKQRREKVPEVAS